MATERDQRVGGQQAGIDPLGQDDAQAAGDFAGGELGEIVAHQRDAARCSGGCIPASVRISVDLPAPLGPIRQTSSPARSVRSSCAAITRGGTPGIADAQIVRLQRMSQMKNPPCGGDQAESLLPCLFPSFLEGETQAQVMAGIRAWSIAIAILPTAAGQRRTNAPYERITGLPPS